MSQLIRGRFEGNADNETLAFTESLTTDTRLAKYDIQGSLAYAQALKKAGILSVAETNIIGNGLKSILKDIQGNKFKFDIAYEDVHMNIEKALIKRIGNAGKKLHTGRSRNDQVITDFKLYLKDELKAFQKLLKNLIKTLISISEKNLDTILPGYTHLQPAQPITLAHQLTAYGYKFQRDLQRIKNVLEQIDECPLGSAALAGTAYPLDRKGLAKALGFKEVTMNSMDAVSDRDYAAEFSFATAMIMTHLSRLAEELIIWNSAEFSFIKLADKYSTGSSIMPQKKNPDILELIRGRSAITIGNLTSFLTMLKALPLTYNRDLQEDKKIIFNSLDLTKTSLSITEKLLKSTTFNKETMRSAAEKGYANATDLADYLANKGLPFRDCHEIVGNLVQFAIKENKRLDELKLTQLKKYSSLIEKDIFSYISLEKVIARRKTIGGTAPQMVKKAIDNLKKKL